MAEGTIPALAETEAEENASEIDKEKEINVAIPVLDTVHIAARKGNLDRIK